MDQWIVVTFPEVRDVLVDDTVSGTTNKLMMVQLGAHTITLGGLQNYNSPPMPVSLFNTSMQAPMVLDFTLELVNVQPPLRVCPRGHLTASNPCATHGVQTEQY